jgi:hypothetical protein
MTEPDRDDESTFGWRDDDEAPSATEPPSRDARRVGLVLGSALVLLVLMFVLLVNLLGGIVGDMWDSVFTF